MGLFPVGDWATTFSFGDETRETSEWWLRDGFYAVWQMTEGGLYRCDPFGGADAPFLLFLPARQWRIERLDLELVQAGEGVKPVAPVP